MGQAPGFMPRDDRTFAVHLGSQTGINIGDDVGLAGEAFFEPRLLLTPLSFGLRTSYFLRTDGLRPSNNSTLAGALETLTFGCTVAEGLGIHGGIGIPFLAAITDQANREEVDVSAIRAMVGATFWLTDGRTFGYAFNLEFDIIEAWGAEQSFTGVAITLGLELGFPAFW